MTTLTARRVALPLALPAATVGLAAAGGIHLGVGLGAGGTALETTFFIAVAAVQGGVALALGTRHHRLAAAVGVWTSLGLVALWALSRTAGLPVGTHAGSPEAMGAADLLASSLEVLAVWTLYPTSRRPAGPRPRPALLVAVLLASALLAPAHRHLDIPDDRPMPAVTTSHRSDGGHG